LNYVVITPARNEETRIARTLDCMCAQSRLPLKWVIVDDGSTDRTAEIVAQYAQRHPWIELVRRPRRSERTFAGKVHAFNAGFERTKALPFDAIGNVDADISFAPDHFESLLTRLAGDANLGVVGAAYTEDGWDSMRDSFEGVESVHGACQLFRRQCFTDVGGYVPHPSGGIDWIAVTTARMKGWKTRNFPDRRFHHHRPMGTAERSAVGAMFDYGKKDYFLGGAPLWQVCRVLYRMTKRPRVIGGLALACGYLWAALSRMERPVTPELMRFHRREQREKLRRIISAVVRLRRIDKFRLSTVVDESGAPPARS
jgi:biofilm PGA synthesis N-glycosyltransferase PgaC